MTTPDISLFADEPAPLSPELQAVVTQVQKKLHWHDLFPRSLPLTFCVIVVAITVSFVFGRLGWHDFTWRGSLSTATFYLAINLTAEFVGKLRLRQKSVNQLCGSDSIRVLPAILAIQETAKNRQRGQSEKWLVERLPTFSESELRTIGGRARRQLIKLLVSEDVSLAEATLDALEKIPASDCLYALGMLLVS